MARELDVWLCNQKIGVLSLIDGRLSFCYTPVWLLRADAIPLSSSLPLQVDPFDDQHTRPFFSGLLPEGQLRRIIAQKFQVSRQNDFALLDHIGGECAGAITLLRPGELITQSQNEQDIQWLNDEEIVALLAELPHRPMLAGRDGLRLSLAGAQDKLPVVFDGERIGLPKNGAPSTHILKPAIRALTDTVINEGFCLALADAMKLKPARSQMRIVQGQRFLLIERYDRVINEQGQLQRLHQEDFCQALGVVPEMKYQNEGGPNLAQCFELIQRLTRPSAPHILRMLDYVIFNALVGNNDAHAKNFSLLYEGKSPVLAPFYDVLSTVVYPNLTPKMAMMIGGKYKFSEVQTRHWDRFLETLGLNVAQGRARILTLAKSMPAIARDLKFDVSRGFANYDVVDQIVAVIEQRCALTERRLTSLSVDLKDESGASI
ncbi:type II toxin-antitoxin system HipA family toxin [Orrella sp. 11846]|uniref:type II toxin-antitoxin system HipA family toxin n=1 Tax=Orrella sp. 11846 TaxID=3409913 RepID=UPI003B5B51E1